MLFGVVGAPALCHGVARARRSLLDDVRELVGDEAASGAAGEIGLAVPDEDVPTGRESSRGEALVQPARLRPAVQAHVLEAGSEEVLHLAAQTDRQRPAPGSGSRDACFHVLWRRHGLLADTRWSRGGTGAACGPPGGSIGFPFMCVGGGAHAQLGLHEAGNGPIPG